MNLRPYYKSAFRPDFFWITVGLLNIILVVTLIYFLFIYPPSPAYDMAVKAVTKLEQNDKFDLHIHEDTGTHSLNFQGKVSGKNLSGTILEHDIVVFFKGDRLYVRQVEESPWENSIDVELEELKAFLITPYEMFSLIHDFIDDVQLGPEKGQEDSIYKTIYWTIDSPEFWTTLFPAIDISLIEEGTFSVEISAKDFDIHHVNLNLILTTPEEEKQIIRRTLNLSPVNQKV